MRLGDVDATAVLAAVQEFGNSDSQYPPSVGQIRTRAIQLAHGELHRPSGAEAWERVLNWNLKTPPAGAPSWMTDGNPDYLTPNELAALKSIGGSSELSRREGRFLRAQFIKRFEELVAKEQTERNATPAAKALVGQEVKRLK
jgi:hypothetical protein